MVSEIQLGKVFLAVDEIPALVKHKNLIKRTRQLSQKIINHTEIHFTGLTLTPDILDEIFSYRLFIVQYLINHPDINKEIQKIIFEEILIKKHLTANNQKLANTVANVLIVHSKISEKISLENLKGKNSQTLQMPSICFSELKELSHFVPSLQYIVKLIEASLQFEFALIVSELILSNKIEATKGYIQKVETLLIKSITDVGALLSISGEWVPNLDDEDTLIRNIKIKKAKLEIEHGISHTFTQKQFRRYIVLH